MKNEHLGKVSGVIDTVMTAASLIASLLAVALTGFITISVLLGIVAAIVLLAGIISLIVIKTKKLESLAQSREAEMKKELSDNEDEEIHELSDIRVQESQLDDLSSIQPSID